MNESPHIPPEAILFGGCEHAYPPGEYCPVCGDVPVTYEDSDECCDPSASDTECAQCPRGGL